MSRQSSIRNLQIVIALDSLCFGLMYRSIYSYIKQLEGTEFTAGILASTIVLGDLFSPKISKIFTNANGKKLGLCFILSITLLCHIMLAVTKSCTFAILMRTLFSSMNQCQPICLQLLLERESNPNTKDKLFSNYNVLSKSGYILGPIISGYVLQKEHGFRYIGMLSAFLTFINVLLLTTINQLNEDVNWLANVSSENSFCCCEAIEDFNEAHHKTLSSLIPLKLQEHIGKLKLNINWDLLTLRYLFTSGIMIITTKSGLLLKDNYYKASSIKIGYTFAFMNTINFIGNYYSDKVKAATDKYPLIFVNELLFFLITVCTLLMCSAPNYELFMFVLVPILLLRGLINALWVDLFSERDNDMLLKLNDSSERIAAFTIPLLFGFAYIQFGAKAVVMFTFVPFLFCWLIIRFYTKSLAINVVRNENYALVNKTD